MGGAIFGRTCEGCDQIVTEPWAKGKTGYRCNAPGPWRGRTMGVEHFLPYIPAWCPKLKNKKEEVSHGGQSKRKG